MKRKLAAVLALALAFAAAAGAQGASAKLPDLKGRVIVAVTENAYTPLNFVDPKTGKAVGWEYDAVNEIAKRLNVKIVWKITAWDTMIQAVRAVVHGGETPERAFALYRELSNTK